MDPRFAIDGSTVTTYWIDHLVAGGCAQMALDESLLEWVRLDRQERSVQPVLVVRTYRWVRPTLSLGVHQHDKDSATAYRVYSRNQEIDLVRRPTGGRAILHGSDVSFAFITNHPALLAMSLDESYCFFTGFVREALEAAGVVLVSSCETEGKAYMRSPLCFETQTPSDLTTALGDKVAGSSQLRRKDGVLQHGAAFLEPHGVADEVFDRALRGALEAGLGQFEDLLPRTHADIQSRWELLTHAYREEADVTLDKISTIIGSHLAPASECSTESASSNGNGVSR